METTWRWSLVTAIAPIAWGTTYFVTRAFLPPDIPLWGAVIRALPAGLLLLALRRTRPRGAWWWRSVVLGTLNMGAFFALVYVAAQLLPTSIAATVMALSPLVMMLLARLFIAERLRMLPLIGGVVGVAGVGLMLFSTGASVNLLGVAASVAAMTMSSLGFILAKRWSGDVDVLALTSWQLIAGGGVLLVLALAVEGPPPALDGSELLAFAYIGIVATAASYAAWFTGLRHLDAGTVGLIGLLNPVTGVLVGTVIAHEVLGMRQFAGIGLVLVGVLLGQPIVRRLARRRPSVSANAPHACSVGSADA
ncbi:DMT family transporter [Leifsonia sp. Leaf264]|uniref:DMT family transporter n=1 Tax=Leifsonia sp. Leaf264 TaxID=1736314 RepID=UPI0006F4BEB7|nr:DMT family transporter [Leifsonia sp. Leaf264]KQO99709.1 ABC transporter permease [Leifsonia sp. Leaf264]